MNKKRNSKERIIDGIVKVVMDELSVLINKKTNMAVNSLIKKVNK